MRQPNALPQCPDDRALQLLKVPVRCLPKPATGYLMPLFFHASWNAEAEKAISSRETVQLMR